jgi:excisionase family DNA binding protein
MVKLLTSKQVAERVGVTSRTIHYWIKQGVFPNAFKINPDGQTSPYCIPETDVEKFEEKRRQSAANGQ